MFPSIHRAAERTVNDAVAAPPARTTWEIVAPDGRTETVLAYRMYMDRGAYWFYDGGHWQDAHTTFPLANVFRCTRLEDTRLT